MSEVTSTNIYGDQGHGEEPWEVRHDDHIYGSASGELIGTVKSALDAQRIVTLHNAVYQVNEEMKRSKAENLLGSVLARQKNWTGTRVTIEYKDGTRVGAYFEGVIGNARWTCALPNGTSAAFSYGGVQSDKETICRVELGRAKSPEEALQVVQKYAYSRGEHRLV